MHVSVCLCVCVFVCMRVCVYVCVCVCVWVHVSGCGCILEDFVCSISVCCTAVKLTQGVHSCVLFALYLYVALL